MHFVRRPVQSSLPAQRRQAGLLQRLLLGPSLWPLSKGTFQKGRTKAGLNGPAFIVAPAVCHLIWYFLYNAFYSIIPSLIVRQSKQQQTTEEVAQLSIARKVVIVLMLSALFCTAAVSVATGPENKRPVLLAPKDMGNVRRHELLEQKAESGRLSYCGEQRVLLVRRQG